MELLLTLEAVLSEELGLASNSRQKQQLIQRYFPGAQVKEDVANFGAWLIVQNEKVAILNLLNNRLIPIPHQNGESEFFGDVSVFPIESSNPDITLPLIITVGGHRDEENGFANITVVGTLDGIGSVKWITNPPQNTHTLHDYIAFVVQQTLRSAGGIAHGNISNQEKEGNLH